MVQWESTHCLESIFSACRVLTIVEFFDDCKLWMTHRNAKPSLPVDIQKFCKMKVHIWTVEILKEKRPVFPSLNIHFNIPDLCMGIIFAFFFNLTVTSYQFPH